MWMDVLTRRVATKYIIGNNLYTVLSRSFLKFFVTLLNYIDTVAPLLALLFFIRPYPKLAKELRYIFWFIVVQFITNLIAKLCETVFFVPNYTLYAINIILSFIILSILFFKLNIPLIRRIFPVTSGIFVATTVISLANGDGISAYNSIVSAFASFIITAYCLIYFYWRLVKDTTTPGLTDKAFFWIIIGIFTYYTGSFFIFISYNYLIAKEFNSIGILWRFHNLLLTIFCIYTIYGLTCKNYQRT